MSHVKMIDTLAAQLHDYPKLEHVLKIYFEDQSKDQKMALEDIRNLKNNQLQVNGRQYTKFEKTDSLKIEHISPPNSKQAVHTEFSLNWTNAAIEVSNKKSGILQEITMENNGKELTQKETEELKSVLRFSSLAIA